VKPPGRLPLLYLRSRPLYAAISARRQRVGRPRDDGGAAGHPRIVDRPVITVEDDGDRLCAFGVEVERGRVAPLADAAGGDGAAAATTGVRCTLSASAMPYACALYPLGELWLSPRSGEVALDEADARPVALEAGAASLLAFATSTVSHEGRTTFYSVDNHTRCEGVASVAHRGDGRAAAAAPSVADYLEAPHRRLRAREIEGLWFRALCVALAARAPIERVQWAAEAAHDSVCRRARGDGPNTAVATERVGGVRRWRHLRKGLQRGVDALSEEPSAAVGRRTLSEAAAVWGDIDADVARATDRLLSWYLQMRSESGHDDGGGALARLLVRPPDAIAGAVAEALFASAMYLPVSAEAARTYSAQALPGGVGVAGVLADDDAVALAWEVEGRDAVERRVIAAATALEAVVPILMQLADGDGPAAGSVTLRPGAVPAAAAADSVLRVILRGLAAPLLASGV